MCRLNCTLLMKTFGFTWLYLLISQSLSLKQTLTLLAWFFFKLRPRLSLSSAVWLVWITAWPNPGSPCSFDKKKKKKTCVWIRLMNDDNSETHQFSKVQFVWIFSSINMNTNKAKSKGFSLWPHIRHVLLLLIIIITIKEC